VSNGPYIVTTKRRLAGRVNVPTADAGPQPFGGERYRVLSRRAVATLDEARMHTWRTVSLQAAYAVSALPESGGTVGPLPDGTVIEVEATTWQALAEYGGLLSDGGLIYAAERGSPDAQQRILDAYNARQHSRANNR
jgi:hypothetical protein